jgi:iron complex outermembrane receptor protein
VKGLASLGFRGFTATAAYSSRRKNIPTAAYGTVFGDTRARTRDEILLVSAGYRGSLGERFDLTTRLTHGAYDYDGAYPYELSPSTTDLFVDFASGRWWGAEATGTLRAGRHTFVLGGEYQWSSRQDQGGRYLSTPDGSFEISSQDHRVGLYAQDDFKVVEKVVLSLGGRFDNYQELGARLNPRLALVVSADPATTVKLLYGRAFRAPNEYERHYYTEADLDAETISTLEVALERALGPNARVVGSLYRSAIRELITLDADDDDSLFFRNSARANALGGELALELRLPRGMAGRFSYSLQRTRNEEGEPYTNSPRHMLKANLSVPLAGERLWASANAQHMSSRITLLGPPAGAFTLANLTVFAGRLPGGFEATAGLYNLFDASYGDPASTEHTQAVIPQDGRSFRLQLSRRFR